MASKLAAVLAVCLLLPSCGMPGQEDPNADFWDSFYSTGKSEEQKEQEWWGGFYGTKPSGDANCSFYGTCKTDE